MWNLRPLNPSFRRRVTGWTGMPVLVAALSGCALLPQTGKLAPLASPNSYASQKSFAAPVADWPSDDWWGDYGDPQLQSLIEEGLANAPDMQAATARITAAKAVAAGADSTLLPTLTGNASGGGILVPQGAVPDGWHAYGFGSADLDWDLDFWGKNHATAAAAHDNARAAQAEAADTRLLLSTAIATDYGNLARLYAELGAAQDAAGIREETTELISKRFALGLENQSAVDIATSESAAAQEQVAELQQQIVLARNATAALIGAGPDRVSRSRLRRY